MNKDELMRKIDSLSFALTETQLFLDTHPDCPAALDYFMQMKAELGKLTDEYEKSYGGLTHSGVSGDTWNWVEPEWPWHAGNGALGMKKDRR